jgi:hypothetical protein
MALSCQLMVIVTTEACGIRSREDAMSMVSGNSCAQFERAAIRILRQVVRQV